MKPVDQTTFEPGKGNCLAAALASLLEMGLDQVPDLGLPHVFTGWLDRANAWLKPTGVGLVVVASEGGFRTPEGLDYVAIGPGPRGRDHAVIHRDGVLVHDPHPHRTGLLNVEYAMFLVRV